MTKFHFLWLTIGEGNGNPLQYSCLENPMDGGAWRATVHGVAKSRTRLSDFTHFTYYYKACVFMYMYVSPSFIHSYVDGHLGCFHILAIVNNAVMNIRVQGSLWIRSFGLFHVYTQDGIAESHSGSVHSFLRNFVTVSPMAARIYILADSIQRFSFLHVFAVCYLLSFWWWPFWQVWGDIPL